MGYKTELHFQCDCIDEKRVEQIMREMRELQIVPYVFDAEFYSYDPCWCGSENRGPCAWYTAEKDMRALSRDFPDVHFIISAFGEINDDIWEAHYLGGKRQLCEAEIRIPEFDPEKLA